MSWTVIGTQRFTPNPLLDQFPDAAAAYSLRNLVGTSNPSVVRVRRSSDDTEQDFTAAQVTDGTLTTFCGAGNGFVRTWYDQSGNNRHVEQTTNANQLRIVNSGTVETNNNKAAIRSPSGYLTLSRAWGIAPVNPAIFVVKKYTTTYQFNLSGHWIKLGNASIGASGNNHFVSSGSDSIYVDYFNSLRPEYGTINRSINTTYLESFRHSGGVGTLRVNGALHGTNSFSAATPTNLLIGGSSADYPATGYLQEIVIYNDLASYNVTDIESAINAHYSIY